LNAADQILTDFVLTHLSQSPDKDKMIRDLGADEVFRAGKSLAAIDLVEFEVLRY
jgi:hypothetical protein